MNEKERVYAELDSLRRRVADQRKEIGHLKRTTSAKENAVLRRESDEYRKALSNIRYRIDNGEADVAVLREIADKALFLRGLKGHQRHAIVHAHGGADKAMERFRRAG